MGRVMRKPITGFLRHVCLRLFSMIGANNLPSLISLRLIEISCGQRRLWWLRASIGRLELRWPHMGFPRDAAHIHGQIFIWLAKIFFEDFFLTLHSPVSKEPTYVNIEASFNSRQSLSKATVSYVQPARIGLLRTHITAFLCCLYTIIHLTTNDPSDCNDIQADLSLRWTHLRFSCASSRIERKSLQMLPRSWLM